MAGSKGHSRAIEIALSFKLIRNEDLAIAREACGAESGPEDHLTWLLDEGRIPESAAAFLSKFMAALRAEAPQPPPDLLDAAKDLLIEKDRLDLVWGAQSSKPGTQKIPIVTEADLQETPPGMAKASAPPPPVALARRSSKKPIVVVIALVALGCGGWFGWQEWQKRQVAIAEQNEREGRLRDAEAQAAPVARLIDAGERPDAAAAKDALDRIAQAQKKVPGHVAFLVLEGKLRELLGEEALAQKAYDTACAGVPGEPSAFAARGLFRWRQVQRERSLPWRAMDLRGMRARREAGEAAGLAKGAVEDCARGGSDALAAAVVALSKGQAPQLAGKKGRDASLLRAIGLLLEEKPDSASKELAGIPESDAAAGALRAAARLMAGDPEGAAAEATKAIEADSKAWAAYEARALARWAKAEWWHWTQECDKEVWKEKVEPLYVAAREDWKRMPLDEADMTPALCAARCAVSHAGGGAVRGADPAPLLQAAILELGAFPKTDAEAQALVAEAHLVLAELLKADGKDSKAEREKVAACLADAEKADPKHHEVLIARGLWEAALGREAEAKAAWAAAKKANPEDPRPDAFLLGKR